MRALVHGELIKLRTTRTAAGFAVGAALLVLLFVLVLALDGEVDGLEDKRAVIDFSGILSFLLLVFGVVGATGEYRHRLLAPSLLVAPARGRLALARVLAYAAVAVLIGLGMLAVAFGLGTALLAGAPGPGLGASDYLRAAVGGLIACALSAAIGVGVGVLVRNQVVAVVGALVWLLIVEPLSALIDEDVTTYTISAATGALGGAGTSAEGPSWWAAISILAAWAAVVVSVGVLVDRSRDVAW